VDKSSQFGTDDCQIFYDFAISAYNEVMNQRLMNFENLAHHAWLKRLFLKMKSQDLDIAREFLIMNAGLSKDDFQHAVNRMYMDSAEKPKHWTEIQELLSNANSALSS
jgi:hypothetical protein